MKKCTPSHAVDVDEDPEDLVLMLTAMFPDVDQERLRKLLAKHAMKIKPVVATLLQYDDYSIDHQSHSASASTANLNSSSGSKSNPQSDREVCRYYLRGDCKLLDCMFSHDVEAANAVCKYWLWGHCSRKEKCIYKHSLPDVQQRQEERRRMEEKEALRRRSEMEQREQRQRRQELQRQKRLEKAKNAKPPSALVMKLKLNSLKEKFPQIPPQVLSATFSANMYLMDEAERVLARKYGKAVDGKEGGIPSAGSGSNGRGAAGLSKKERAAERKRVEGNALMVKIGWVPTGDALNDLYRSSRNEAERHAKARNQLFMDAVDAYCSGKRKRAKELSRMGREHDAEMKRLHRIASEHIFAQRNGRLGLNVLDCHGLHVDEAIRKLKGRIAKIRKGSQSKKGKKGKGGQTLDVLTGTGHHSYGGTAKVGPAIRQFAQSKGIRFKKLTFVDGRGGNLRLFIS